MNAIFRHAADDFIATAASFRIWNLLALQDVRQRYRRSILGPFWITLSSFVSIAALAVVYTKIFKIPTADYLPYLSVGFIAWMFIASILTESCGVFIAAEGIIKQINLPFGVHVMRMVWRNLITLGHHAVVLAVVLTYAGVGITADIIFLPFALALNVLTGVFVGYLLGAASTRFRDISPIVSSLVQVVFYVTPVIWQPVLLKGHEELLLYNPFFHYLEIMRMPILGMSDKYGSWWVCIGITLTLGIMSIIFMARFRKRIAFWL